MASGVRTCKACGKEVGLKVAKCPHCGTPQPVWTVKHTVLTFFGVIFALGALGSIGGNSAASKVANLSSVSTVNNIVKEVTKNDIVVDDIKMVKSQYGIKTVTGVATNTTDTNFAYAQVEINLYDAEGAQVGSTLANIHNLEPNGKWKFSAPVIEEKAVSAKFKGVTHF